MQDILTIDTKIYVVRGVQVMLDFDLAQIYNDEFDNLRSHFATTNLVMTRTKPFAFTY